MPATKSTAELRVTGLLATDPVVNDKVTVLRFSIRKDSPTRRQHPTYVNVKVFGDQVKAVQATLAKATPWATTLLVAGELVEERWERDGQQRRTTYCYAQQVSISRAA